MDLWWFICLEEGVTCCSVFAACIFVHISISNVISLFILHFLNLMAIKSHARVLLFSYWIWKSSWKTKRQRFEFLLSLAVWKGGRERAGFKTMKHLCEEQSVLELNMVCVFLKLSICLLNGTHTIFFFPLHYLLDLFFPEQNFVLALLFGTFCFPVTITSEPTPFKMFMGFLC